jgi:hypothetical protein
MCTGVCPAKFAMISPRKGAIEDYEAKCDTFNDAITSATAAIFAADAIIADGLRGAFIAASEAKNAETAGDMSTARHRYAEAIAAAPATLLKPCQMPLNPEPTDWSGSRWTEDAFSSDLVLSTELGRAANDTERADGTCGATSGADGCAPYDGCPPEAPYRCAAERASVAEGSPSAALEREAHARIGAVREALRVSKGAKGEHAADDTGTLGGAAKRLLHFLNTGLQGSVHPFHWLVMEAHAARLCATGGDVLNVGFGMGIIDGLIAARAPRSHTIMEAHPAVLERMRADGWAERPGVRILGGRWQQTLPVLLAEGMQFDGIFFDTYGERYRDMADFHEQVRVRVWAGV